jgi:RNA polymerase sigma-70 factor (ECF subfamily)
MQENQCIISQAKAGDPNAMAEIYRQYRDPLMALATRYCRDSHAAEDVLQDVFLSFMVQLPRLTLRTSLLAYLKASILNRVRNQFRKKARHQQPIPANEPETAHADPEKQAVLKEQISHLQQSLLALPRDQRDVLMWRVYGGHSFARISELQASHCGTVRARYRYGRTKLALLCSHVA